MENVKNQSFSNTHDGVIGYDDISSLDDLITVTKECTLENSIPTSKVIQVLGHELNSDRIQAHLNEKFTSFRSLKSLQDELKLIPEKFYYFLWGLNHRTELRVNGIISSDTLETSLRTLCKFIAVAEKGVSSVPNRLSVFDKLASAYFQLASLARCSESGIMLKNKRYSYTFLLRKAVSCWQNIIHLEAEQSKQVDTSHIKTLNLFGKNCQYGEERVYLYLNPWSFFYIISALRLLKDEESVGYYLKKVEFILQQIRQHQNPRIFAQHELLSAIYHTMRDVGSISFDFNAADLNQNLAVMGNSASMEKPVWSDDEIKRLVNSKKLTKKQITYLRSILQIYQSIESSGIRNKLIFHLNIPPLDTQITRSITQKFTNKQFIAEGMQASAVN